MKLNKQSRPRVRFLDVKTRGTGQLLQCQLRVNNQEPVGMVIRRPQEHSVSIIGVGAAITRKKEKKSNSHVGLSVSMVDG